MSAGPNLFTGPAGSCPDCGQATLVRLGSFVAKPKEKNWVASHALIHEIYRQIKSVAVSGGGYVKVKDPKTKKTAKKYTIGKIVRCTHTTKCAEKKAAARYIWVALGSKSLGSLPERLVGPFCGICWPTYKNEFSHTDGMDFSLPVYYVITTFEALQPIFESEDPPVEKPTKKKLEDLEVEGLF